LRIGLKAEFLIVRDQKVEEILNHGVHREAQGMDAGLETEMADGVTNRPPFEEKVD